MKKVITFFGDSFVAMNSTWISDLCLDLKLDCRHLGKPGADPYYAFGRFKEVNNTYKKTIDYCIYAHTEVSRPYVESNRCSLNYGLLYRYINKLEPIPKDLSDQFTKEELQAIFTYYTKVTTPKLTDHISDVVPLGIDRYIKENNKIFKKIVHIWGFAPKRYDPVPDTNHWVSARPEWPFDMISGSNLILDLSNLSYLDLDDSKKELLKKENNGFIDQRPNHFTGKGREFMKDVIKTMLLWDGDNIVDFRPYINSKSTMNDYFDAWNTIKNSKETVTV